MTASSSAIHGYSCRCIVLIFTCVFICFIFPVTFWKTHGVMSCCILCCFYLREGASVSLAAVDLRQPSLFFFPIWELIGWRQFYILMHIHMPTDSDLFVLIIILRTGTLQKWSQKLNVVKMFICSVVQVALLQYLWQKSCTC